MVLEEKPFLFDFDDAFWKIIQYDGPGELFRTRIEPQVYGSKAIDFLGIYEGKRLVLFEIKAFKGHMSSKVVKQRLANGGEEISTEIAQKVRDSLAGVVSGGRSSTSPFWTESLRLLATATKEVYVIAWIEQDPNLDSKWIARRKCANPLIRQTLQRKLNWLTKNQNIFVTSSTEYLGEEMNFKVQLLPQQP
jgi:hypothetical protein